jgi:hypothetical protein
MFRTNLLVLLLPIVLGAQQHPRDKEIADPDTRAWWHLTEDLSGDTREGRDTGSAAYSRAATDVANFFRAVQLKAAGENGTFLQQVPMHEVAVTKDGTSFTLVGAGGKARPLKFLWDISINASESLPPKLEAALAFRGYCAATDMTDVQGKLAVCFNSTRKGMTTAVQRLQAARGAGAAGLILVDDPYFLIEPPRWPAAYARSVTLMSAKPNTASLPTMRLSAAAFTTLLEGTAQNAAELLNLGGHMKPLPSFEIESKLRVTIHITTRDYSSPNVLAVLPGTDPKLKSEYVVIAAHLDGYGYGEAVDGDELYNGALDDAAYVALLMQFAARQQGHGFRRSVLFCAFTGEEKGLLGSNWFVQHLTVPKADLAADINLDQLRPLFPLKILTALAVDESTLGQTAREVGGSMSIEIRPDKEPERRLLTRADHWPFMQIGVPAIGFIFGYDGGTDAETRYREWYRVRYHRPQDDLTQPMDFEAATKFNSFFYKLVQTVADADNRPHWLDASAYKPKPQSE